MKMPATLILKDEKTMKRNRGIKTDFESRKEDYKQLKELRQKLKIKKQEKIDGVKLKKF